MPVYMIHLNWDGPFSLEAVKGLKDGGGCGVYQIYGAHIVYGNDVLLYIGQTNKRTFAERLGEHHQEWMADNHDTNRLRFYLGRVVEEENRPVDGEWRDPIDLTERLLIYACGPAYNSQQELSGVFKTKHPGC